jgi:hypothetical protein
MNHLLTTTSAVANAEQRETAICQMFMSATLHEPSADMTGAVASAAKRTASQADVHECKHSMNHLRRHRAVASAEQQENSVMCQMFMSANTP